LIGLGVSSVKVFSAYNNRLRLQDSEIFKVLRIAKKSGLLTMLHAENGDVIELLTQEALKAGRKTPEWHVKTHPAWGSIEAVSRGAALSAIADASLYIVHMNVDGEVDQLEYARKMGLKVMGETCPQYLFFSQDFLKKKDGAKYVCSPPLRQSKDQERLWGGLKNGTIQTIATDHCPFFYNGKKSILYEGIEIAIPGKELGKDDFTKIPNGLPGIGDRMPVLFTAMVTSGIFTLNEFVRLTCTNPARIFGLYPKKGVLSPGADADIVIWDPQKKVVHGIKHSQQRTDYNLYEGWNLTGYPTKVFLRGKLIVEDERWLGEAGEGKYLPRDKFLKVR
jgi:dihydropyrimidinase